MDASIESFGYHYLESVFLAKGVEIVVLNDVSQEKDVGRRVFHDLKHGIPKEMGMGRYITYICNAYGILKRTANSIWYDMQGRIRGWYTII